MTKVHDALDDIIKLHIAAPAPTDHKAELVCTTCAGKKLEVHPEWPCRTVQIAHRALNPQIPIEVLVEDVHARLTEEGAA